MTRFEQIASAFPLHAQRIAELAGPEMVAQWREQTAKEYPFAASDLLRGAFHWAATSEGDTYWRALYEGAAAK